MSDTTIYYNGKNRLGGIGFCDLYDWKSGEVWELKRKSDARSCKTSAAKAQLDNYVSGRLKAEPGLELKVGYTKFSSGSLTVTDWTGQYKIDYWEEGEGILRYDYTYDKDQRLACAEAVVTVVVAGALIYSTSGVGSPAVAPALGAAWSMLAA